MRYGSFVFEDYSFDEAKQEASLRYSFDGQLKFEEKISWNVDSTNYNPAILERALFGLWLMSGVSYYKAYVPRSIIIKKGSLDKYQKEFFDQIYLNGLAQFFYTNQIDWKNLIDFPFDKAKQKLDKLPSHGSGSLVAIGGGKDSIVAAELMNCLGGEFDCWSVNQAERFEPIASKLGQNILNVKRSIDPKLIEINAKDAYNGHVPVTAINYFIGVVLGVLTGRQSLVWAIESSTDEPNTTLQGLEVNHQYSKTSFFEERMQHYIGNYIATDIECFSILRPLSELRIAEIFCNNYLEKYQGLYSSCNANFSIGNNRALNWCGKCPKCAFIFTIFSPFLKKEKLLELFGGKDIFADPDMKGTLEELLGIDGHKPLECVGEIAEVRAAVDMARRSGRYPELAQFDFELKDFDYKSWGPNSIPASIESKLQEIIKGL